MACAAIAVPSSRACGVQRMISRSLKVPGSDSSAFTQSGGLHFLGDRGRLHRHGLLQGLVPAALHPPLVGAGFGVAEVLREDDGFLLVRRMWGAHALS